MEASEHPQYLEEEVPLGHVKHESSKIAKMRQGLEMSMSTMV